MKTEFSTQRASVARNEYDTASIENVHYNKEKDQFYANIYSDTGVLLVSATLDYCVEVMKARITNGTAS